MQESRLRPDPHEYNVCDVPSMLPAEIVEYFCNRQENVWNIHGCVNSVSNERQVDSVAPS